MLVAPKAPEHPTGRQGQAGAGLISFSAKPSPVCEPGLKTSRETGGWGVPGVV